MFEYLDNELYPLTGSQSRTPAVAIADRTVNECQFQDISGTLYTLRRVLTTDTRTQAAGHFTLVQSGVANKDIRALTFNMTKRQLDRTCMSATFDYQDRLVVALTDDNAKRTIIYRFKPDFSTQSSPILDQFTVDGVTQSIICNSCGDHADWHEPGLMLISLVNNKVTWRQFAPGAITNPKPAKTNSKVLPAGTKLASVGYAARANRAGIWFKVKTPNL